MIFLWGANARENHPIFFHHVLKGIHNGAKLFVVDPRRTASAQWADHWLGLNVGIGHRALQRDGPRDHPQRAGRRDVHPARHDRLRCLSGQRRAVHAGVRRARDRGARRSRSARPPHVYARADRAEICWTLGITEHHNAVDNVLSLINLALLTGHVGKYGSGVNPLRGQNNVQGGGDMGAIPNRLVGIPGLDHRPGDPRQVREGLGGHRSSRSTAGI